ncbi:MAG: TIGR03915 family putative DNA repair protein, partial [Bacteroidota bacterium]
MNTNHHTLSYDESFEGFLTCIFYLFERKLERVDVVKKSLFHQNMFSTHQEVLTDRVQAERVCRGLKKRLPKNEYKRLYAAFLSEQTEVERLLVAYIRRLFTSKRSFAGDYADDTVLQLTQLARKVGREAHRMEAFVRFKLTKDGLYYANIEPDFDVLPLVGQHFKDRYADQRWLIYDLKRKYGIYYDLQSLEPV